MRPHKCKKSEECTWTRAQAMPPNFLYMKVSGCPRMDMNFKKFQEKRQVCLFMLMCGDARVLENLNAEDITMTEINGNQWTFSDFSQKSI